MPGVLLNPGGCCCSATGTICVLITAPCHSGDQNGYAVTIKDHATGNVVATGTTASGVFCQSGLPTGRYDVTATKANSNTIEWLDQTLTGGVPLDLTGDAYSYPFAGRLFTVRGCGSRPVPGATISISGPESTTLTTNSGGLAYYFPVALGLYSYSITEPSGRCATATGTWTEASCGAGAITRTLAAASGFVCCDDLSSYLSDYHPVKSTLVLTDAGGSSSFSACSDTLCLSRTMDNVSPSNAQGTTPCSDIAGVQVIPPTDITTAACNVKYSIALPGLSQSIHQFFGFAGFGLNYRAASVSDGKCSPTDTYQTWRFDSPCTSSTSLAVWTSSSTVNSVFPFSLTYSFAGGTGFGPSPTPVNGDPYSPTVTISE